MSYNPDSHNAVDTARTAAPAGIKTGPNIALIAALVIAAIAVIFFFQNGEYTSVDFLIFEKRTTIRWSILMAALLGAVIDRLAISWWRRRKSAKAESKK